MTLLDLLDAIKIKWVFWSLVIIFGLRLAYIIIEDIRT